MPEQTIIPAAVQGSQNHAGTAASPIKIYNMDTYYDKQLTEDVADFKNNQDIPILMQLQNYTQDYM